jgi:hypothetical protein
MSARSVLAAQPAHVELALLVFSLVVSMAVRRSRPLPRPA